MPPKQQLLLQQPTRYGSIVIFSAKGSEFAETSGHYSNLTGILISVSPLFTTTVVLLPVWKVASPSI